jgi:hypothetical protein
MSADHDHPLQHVQGFAAWHLRHLVRFSPESTSTNACERWLDHKRDT